MAFQIQDSFWFEPTIVVLAKKCDFSRVSVWAGRVEFLFATLRLIEYWSGYYDWVYDEKIKQRQGAYIMIMEGRGLNLVSLLVEASLELRVGMSD